MKAKLFITTITLLLLNSIKAQYSSSCININNSGSIDVNADPNTSITTGSWGAWVNFNSVSGSNYQRIIYKEGIIELFFYEPLKRIEAEVTTSSGFYEIYSDSLLDPIQVNKWYFIMATFDSSNLKLYINGNIVDSLITPNSTINPTNGTWGIGAAPSSSIWRLNGKVDDVMLFDRALNAQEINDIMCSLFDSFHPLYSDFVAYYKFDENSGTTVIDPISFANGNFFATPQWFVPGRPINSQPYINQNGSQLNVYNGMGTYQWYLNNVAISSSNNDTLSISSNGQYFVTYANEMGCLIHSDTISISTIGISENQNLNEVLLYPNPISKHLFINSFPHLVDRIEIYDLLGHLIISCNTSSTIDVENLIPNIYIVKLYKEYSIVQTTKIFKH